MRKLYLSAIAFFTIAFNSNAQQWIWATQVGDHYSSSNSSQIQVRTNSSGNLFTAGTFENSATISSTTFNSARGIYVARFDNSNQLIWTKMIGGSNTILEDISIDMNNNTYVLGVFANQLILPDTTITNTGDYESFIIAFNPSGQRSWVKIYPSSTIPSYIINDKNNDLIYACASSLTSSVWRIKKISPSGNEIWSKTDSCSGTIKGIKLDSQNNIYIAAIFYGNEFKIGNTMYYDETGSAVSSCLVKLNTAGAIQNVEIIRGAMIKDFGLDSDDNIYTLGEFDKSMKIRQFTFSVPVTCLPPDACNEYFLAKLNTTGRASWAFQKKSNDPLLLECISVAQSGNFYLGGAFKNSVVFNAVTLTEPETRFAVFILKFNTNGVAQWGGKNSGDDITDCLPSDIAYSENKSIYLSGTYHNNNKNCWFGNDSLASTGVDTYIFLAKMIDDPAIGIHPVQKQADFLTVMPNPSQGLFTIHSNGQFNDMKICIYDVLGNTLLNMNMNSSTQIIDLGAQPKGIYFMEMIDKGERKIKKIILQ
ncbi:MAG: T9SS type A sorting domain-containing protein [Bacteroidota bacterium]